jgi:hypothetical protein
LRHAEPALPLAIVVSARAGTLGAQRSHQLGFADRITLSGLSVAECAEARSIDPGLVLATGGNPALLSDLWRWRRAGKGDRPPSLEDTVKRRIRGLGATLASLAQAAALCGNRFTIEDLSRISGREPGAVADGLARLGAHELIEAVGTSFCFTQPVVREVLLTTVSPPARAPRLPAAPVLAKGAGSGGGPRPAVSAAPGLGAPMVARTSSSGRPGL